MPFKPEGHTSAAPYLVVDGAAAAIEFIVQVFGATELMRVPGQPGKVGHAELRIDDTVVMLCDAIDGFPAVAAHVHVYVPDAMATFARALAAGAEAVQEPVQKQDADLRGGFRAHGTTWWVGTQVGDAAA